MRNKEVRALKNLILYPRQVRLLLFPGGGHRELWITHEGYNPAGWFSERDITAFVLKYRLAHDTLSTYTIDKDELADIQRAIRLVRSRAKEGCIDTARIGVMGFSAGGEVAALSAMRFDDGKENAIDPVDRQSSRPAFQALIYPGNSGRFEVAKITPPLFLAGGNKDRPTLLRQFPGTLRPKGLTSYTGERASCY